MATWSPNTIGSANWAGNPTAVTKNQLLSTSAGLYDDIQNVNISTINLSTLTVPDWISTTTLYASDIKGAKIDISGIVFDASGLLYAPLVSSQQGIFNITNVSVMQLTFKPTFTGNIQVTFDLGLGEAIGGLLAGLGAAVGGALIGVGTGVGLAIQGAEQGIATMVAGRPQNFINNTTYETINFTSQLQVSTIGNAYPLYSSIFRTVSSSSANEIPGQEIFLSSFFLPGQICVRTVSDPFNLISGDSNLNTSTIQSFGQWVPLEGLEPDNIVAQSVSTVQLEANNAIIEVLQSQGTLIQNTLQVGQNNFPAQLVLPYESFVQYQTGPLGNNFSRQLGDLNAWWFQSDQDIIFSKFGPPGTTPFNAQLSLGSNANESYLQVSSIFSRGNIQANSGFFSTLQVEQLIVISSLSTIYTQSNVNIISTAIVEANTVLANTGVFSTIATSSISQFNIQSVLGNSNGPFDINIYDSFASTSYFQVSSIQQNILNASLNIQLQDEALLNLGDGPLGIEYKVTPQNIEQWGSTILYWTGLNPGTIDLGWVGQWGVSPGDVGGVAPGGATFDVWVDPTGNPNGLTGNFYILEDSNNAYPFNTSTLFQVVTPGDQGNSNTYKLRFTLPPVVSGSRSGWWNYTVGYVPYQSSNNNTLQIFQDLNDSYIQGTDRLHIVAGDILLDGTVSFSNFAVNNITAGILSNTLSFISSATISTATIGAVNISTLNASNITVNPVTGGIDTYYFKPSSLSFNSAPQSVTPLQMSFIQQSPDYIPIFNLIPPFMGSNEFTSYNVSSWNNTQWNNTTALALGKPGVYVGDVQTTLGSYSGFFYINNDAIGTPYPLPIYVITAAGVNTLGTLLGGQYGRIRTSDGQTWYLDCNVPNPQGTTGGFFSNIMTVTQQYSQTTINNTQNLSFQAPNTSFLTGSLNLYADQIRVNSRRYGSLQSATLPSFPIGIENTVYIDSNIVFSYVVGTGNWQSDAANILYNINNTIFYDANSWIVQIIPSRFRIAENIQSWDVQPAIFPISGSSGYCWGYNRYILVQGNPGSGTNNWNWVIAFPKNYCTYQ